MRPCGAVPRTTGCQQGLRDVRTVWRDTGPVCATRHTGGITPMCSGAQSTKPQANEGVGANLQGLHLLKLGVACTDYMRRTSAFLPRPSKAVDTR
jgi:hypothetical protein